MIVKLVVVVMATGLVTHQSQLHSLPSTLQGADVLRGSPALSGSRGTAPGATVRSIISAQLQV